VPQPPHTGAGERQPPPQSAGGTASAERPRTANLGPRAQGRGRYVLPALGIVLLLTVLAGYWLSGNGRPESPPQAAATQAAPPGLAPSGAPAQNQKPVVPAEVGKTSTDGRYTLQQCGAIVDSKTGLQWLVGPDKNTTWDEAARWSSTVTACDGSWEMPTIEQLKSLFDPRYTAGTGFVSGGRAWPAHIDPVFEAIGQGSWVWSANPPDANSAHAFNFNQGKPARYSRDDTTFTTRAFAVRAGGTRRTGAPRS
jgi:hypothetical protein